MAKDYTHLNFEERVVIRVMLKDGKSMREISRELCRAPSTISRELRRNEQFANTRVIYPVHAQMKANGRRRRSYRKPRLKTTRLQRYVVRKLKDGWSPEVIAGRLRQRGKEVTVSHEAIYQYIYQKRPDLRIHLPRHHMKRKRFGQSKRFRNKTPIPARISISERPATISDRSELGHWEGDLMVARADQTAVHVLIERKSRRVCISKVENRKALTIRNTITNRLKHFPRACRKTLTYDNGKENVEHQAVNASLCTQSYFCDPYSSWQKGSVENVIGIIRRTYPKRTNLSAVSFQELKLLERDLNHRPRKSLQFRTPMEVFKESSVALQS